MEVRDNLSDHQIVVGCIRDSLIHIGMQAFQMMASGLFDKVITLAEAKFMVAADCGEGWKALAAAQPIFGYDEHKVPVFVTGGLAVPKQANGIVPTIEGEVIPASVN